LRNSSGGIARRRCSCSQSILNGLPLAEKVGVAAALDAGGHPELTTRFNPLSIEVFIALPTGSRLLLAKHMPAAKAAGVE
jgi:hypothetical protein